MPKRLPFLCALCAYKLLRRAFSASSSAGRWYPGRSLRWVSLSLGSRPPGIRRCCSLAPVRLLRSSPSLAERPRLPLRAPRAGLCDARLLEQWWWQRRKKERKKKTSGEEQAKEEKRQKKATSEGKLVRTGAVCKNGKVDRRRWHKSVSRPAGARGGGWLCPPRGGWPRSVGSHRCEGAGGRQEGALRTPPPASTPSSGLELESLGVRAPSPAAASRGEREQPRSGRRPPARGSWGSQGVVFGSEEVPAQPSKFCPKADKRIAPR